MAHYSQDPTLIAAFKRGDDIHRQTASQIFSVASELVTAEMRRAAKTINFGIVYGMSSYGLANQLNVSRKEAQSFIDRYFAHFSGIQEFMERVVAEADIMKKAMVQVDGQLVKNAFQAKMILQIHDELVLEVPDKELTAVATLLQESMENAAFLDVPLTVHLDYGQNLGKDERVSLV